MEERQGEGEKGSNGEGGEKRGKEEMRVEGRKEEIMVGWRTSGKGGLNKEKGSKDESVRERETEMAEENIGSMYIVVPSSTYSTLRKTKSLLHMARLQSNWKLSNLRW